jgi:hypothetical protein
LHLTARAFHLQGRPFQCRRRLGKILVHFRYFQDRDQLALLHPVSNVDMDGFEIARDFGVQIDFLVRVKLRGQFQVANQIVPRDFGYGRGGYCSG